MNALRSIAWLACALHSLAACGSGPVAPRVPDPPAPRAPAERVTIWSARGGISTVGGAGMGERAVYVIVSQRLENGRFEQRLHAIDRASRRATSRLIGEEVELIRVDPLIVDSWDGERQRWLGTRIVRLSDALEPLWRSDPMNMSVPRYATGPLVIVEQSQAGEYVGLDPEDGAVVFRLRGEPDGIMNYAIEGGSFIAIPTEDRVILVERESGEISGVVPGELGGWEVIGDRLIVADPDRLIAYDGHGVEAWSREGVFPLSPARTILSWMPDVPPGRSDVLLVWERGRGLVAIDEAGESRWAHPITDEEAWSHVVQRGERVFLSEPATMLDVRTGRVLFEGPEGCRIARDDEQGVLVTETTSEGGAAVALYGYDGERRWRYVPELADEEDGPSVALLSDVVALCPRGGPVTFLDRTDGSVLSTHPMTSDPGEQRDGSEFCSLHPRDELVLAVTNQGAALFGPARDDDDTPAEPIALEPVEPPPEDGSPASRPLYQLATLVPPADGPAPPEYVQGRAAYLRARAAFQAERFQEAADGFIEAYRAFFAADAGAVKQLGLECCYNARISVDHAGGGPAYDALLAGLTDAEEHCRGIVVRAPPPSRPF